ncbi:mersacidin/lichenicidin family type 2 lantibiotic, partial [Archangium sp.]|uniref:mersacidin/lichenicidin family type 2 lantibiotic n=1 Tax=Archangium sp. TaxID=1872627 RepID=UPI00389A5F5C
MSNIDVVRAWKDEQYRMSLSETERASLPMNPAGMVELTDADLEGVAGGSTDISVARTSCCTYSTS